MTSAAAQARGSAQKPWSEAECLDVIARSEGVEGALLPLLHDIQEAFGWVPDEAVALVAEALNLSRAEVHGVVTFYHDFRRRPPGRRIVRLCQSEACQARGGRTVAAAAERLLGVSLGATSADGDVSLEPVYCLGLCASGPAALVDGRPVARLDAADLRRLSGEPTP